MNSLLRPRFSVIISTFNRGEGILPTLQAASSMDFDSYEIIVVDDGSTDGTPDLIRSLPDPRIRLVERPNGGISAGRNSGAEAARGEFLVPLDDDDIPHAGWLRSFDLELSAHDAAVVSCGCTYVSSETGATIEELLPRTLGPEMGGFTALFLAGTFAVRSDVYFAVGGFTEGLQSSHQTEFSLRLLPYCSSRGLEVVAIRESRIDICRRGTDARIERNPAKLLQGTEYILDTHGPLLRAKPGTMANYRSVAGVAAYRLGQRKRARSHFFRAVAAEPLAFRHLGRLLCSIVPPVADRVWAVTSSSDRDNNVWLTSVLRTVGSSRASS